MSAYGNVDLALEAMKAGAYDYIQKPFKAEEVVLTLRKAEERESLRRENRALRQEIRKENLFEDHPRQEPAHAGHLQDGHQDRRLQDDRAHHRRERRRQGAGRPRHPPPRRAAAAGPSSPSTAAPSPRTLLESELFGYKKGAFTDATTDRTGLFEQANHGTLLLDEIGELPLSLQVKLLRVLQEETIRRLGDNKDIKIDVRILAATHRDLQRRDQGRPLPRGPLSTASTSSPSPSPRSASESEDMPLLIDHFVARNNARFGTNIRGVDTEARRLLAGVRAGPATCASWRTPSSAPWSSPRRTPSAPTISPSACARPRIPIQLHLTSGELSIKKTARVIEEILIRRALTKTKGNRTRAAEVLEISHRALLYKIKDYHIDL